MDRVEDGVCGADGPTDGSVGSSKGTKEGSLTFPLRPKRRVVVVQTATNEATEGTSNQATSSPKENGEKKVRRVLIAKTISSEQVQVDSAQENSVTYSSLAYGALEPISQPASCMDERKRDLQGNIIPYSILGRVDDFVALDNLSCAPNVQRGSSQSSRCNSPSNTLGASRSSPSSRAGTVSKGKLSTANSTSSVSFEAHSRASSSAASSFSSLPLYGGTGDIDNYIESVRMAASEEAARRSNQAQAKLASERQLRLGGLQAHEQLMFDRQERALTHYEQWQEEWAKFNNAMCRITGKRVEDLVVSRAKEHRRRIEEYNFISRATPHHEKHGSEYWQMSLRGLGTRYVAVGNIFSGLFCPVREAGGIGLEMVRVPESAHSTSSNTVEHNGDGDKHKQLSTLAKRRQQLAAKLKEIRPHELSDADAADLVIAGEPLLEWAYVSSAIAAVQDAQPLQGDHHYGVTSLAHSEANSPALNQESTDRGPSLCLTANDSADQVQGDECGCIVGTMRAVPGERVSWTATMRNTGQTALYFDWQSKEESPILAQLRETGNVVPRGESMGNVNRFFCSEKSGVLLPGEKRLIAFTFQSHSTGSWAESWQVATRPALPAPLSLSLRGIAYQTDDATRLSRQELSRQLAEAESIIAKDLQVAREAAALPPPPPRSLSEEELRARFEECNRALGLFYSNKLYSALPDLARKVFTKLRQFDLSVHHGDVERAVEQDTTKWLERPSVAVLRAAIADLAAGKPLFPECRNPTVASSADARELDLLDLNPEAPAVQLSSGFFSADALKEHIGASSTEDYLVSETQRLRMEASELDRELISTAALGLRREEELSPIWSAARACVLAILDSVAVAVEDARAEMSDYELAKKAVQDAERALEVATAAHAAASGKKVAETAALQAAQEALQHATESTPAFAPLRGEERVAASFSECVERFCSECLEIDQSQRLSATRSLLPSRDPETEQSWIVQWPRASELNPSAPEMLARLQGFVRGKHVLLQAGLNVASAASDRHTLDENEASVKLGPVAAAITWLLKGRPRTITVVGNRGKEAGSAPTLQLIADDLTARLERDVIFVDDLSDLVEEEAEEIAEIEIPAKAPSPREIPAPKSGGKKGEPAPLPTPTPVDAGSALANELNEIPVRLVENLLRPSVLAEFKTYLGTFNCVVVDSVDALSAPETILDMHDQVTRIVGPNLESEINHFDSLLSSAHCIVIGGKGLPFLDGSGRNEEDDGVDDDEGEETEEQDEEEEEEEEGEEEEEEEEGDEERIDREASVAEENNGLQEKAEGGDVEDRLEEVSAAQISTSALGDKSLASAEAPEMKYAPQGFSEQISILNTCLNLGLAKSIVMCGPLAVRCAKAIDQLGASARRRLLTPHCSVFDHVEQELSETIPSDLKRIFSPPTCTSASDADLESLRNVVEKARRLGVPVALLDLPEQSSLHSEQKRALLRAALDNPKVQSCIILDECETQHATRLLLREVGSRIKANKFVSAALFHRGVHYQASVLISGGANDEFEAERLGELERMKANGDTNEDRTLLAEEEDEEAADGVQLAAQDKSDTEGDVSDTFGLASESVRFVLSAELSEVFKGRALRIKQLFHK